MKEIGNRLKKLRNEKNLSQDELATNIGCSSQAIYRYENNRSLINTTTLIDLALYFNVTTDYLLGLSNSKNTVDSEDNKSYLYNIILGSKCNSPLVDKSYYWISKDSDTIGGQTSWAGFTADGKEIRKLREVIPDKSIKLCSSVYGRPMVINTKEEAIAFSIIGGHAIIESSICKEHLPEFLEPFTV
ncbi:MULTISPECIES: helix-turn-helix transcriptional regulator [unclassified Clostridium]|uniref:helix-turn-helix domain-containing protein n=1 Tax=unclassified Clostridium TaxID=2614128 RepID=UPI002A8191EF|nr:helix-turn-helix transcriptional regulator [Clostridium sp.]MDY4253628.1 helix-turn-helix transcriptional regulator [Clostridium sp.]